MCIAYTTCTANLRNMVCIAYATYVLQTKHCIPNPGQDTNYHLNRFIKVQGSSKIQYDMYCLCVKMYCKFAIHVA